MTGTSPANGSSGAAPANITVTFNWDVSPDGADFNNAIVVMQGATAVAGTIGHNSAGDLSSVTDTLGRVVSVTYDGNGNQTSSSLGTLGGAIGKVMWLIAMGASAKHTSPVETTNWTIN